MPPRKKEALSAVSAAAESTAHVAEEGAHKLQRKSTTCLERIHPVVRFALAVFTSLVLSSTLFSLTTRITLGELGSVSKHLEEWWEVAGLMAWKTVEVGLAWIFGFDGRDVTSYIFLTHLPTYALLASFYNIRPTTILLSYAITLFSTSIPFILLRHPSPVHSDLSGTPGSSVANRAILHDRLTTIYTTLAATSIFTTVLYISYATYLPAKLVLHFQDIPDISAVHAGPEGLPILFLALLPAGCAARDFLFVSSAGAAPSSTSTTDKGSSSSSSSTGKDRKDARASHEGEYLACAVYRKTWGRLPTKTRVLAGRTAVLATVLFANTVVQVAGTVKGVSVEGATAWAGVWATATVVVGVLFGWIEGVDGV